MRISLLTKIPLKPFMCTYVCMPFPGGVFPTLLKLLWLQAIFDYFYFYYFIPLKVFHTSLTWYSSTGSISIIIPVIIHRIQQQFCTVTLFEFLLIIRFRIINIFVLLYMKVTKEL